MNFGTRTLYAYAHPSRADAHAVKLRLDADDFARVATHFEAEADLHHFESGEWFEVTDRATGRRWEVRTAPCERTCRCAADARPVA